MLYCMNRYQCTCWWTPSDHGVTWVRPLEALDKVIDKGNCTLACKHTHSLKSELI